MVSPVIKVELPILKKKEKILYLCLSLVNCRAISFNKKAPINEQKNTLIFIFSWLSLENKTGMGRLQKKSIIIN